jgi:hypothetical protein
VVEKPFQELATLVALPNSWVKSSNGVTHTHHSLHHPFHAPTYTIEIRLLVEKGPIYLADVLAMDKSHVGAAPRLFCGFFLK